MKRRLRWRRRRLAALVLAPLALLAAATSITVAAAQTAGGTSLEAGRDQVGYGERLRLRGSGGSPGNQVAIEFQRAGEGSWTTARTVEADASGGFATGVRGRYTGNWRAVPAGGTPSAPLPVRVRARVTLRPDRYTVLGERLRLRGRVRPGPRRVVVGVGGERLQASARRDGRFSVAWRPERAGSFRTRATARGDELAGADRDRGRKVTVYRRARASWYGPGLYGNRMACGGTLRPDTLGVAHKTLPCGTRVRLRYGKRTVTAPVVDRGPYVGGREFDLTAKTKRRLGFGSTGTVLSSK